MPYGRNQIGNTSGIPFAITADGQPEWKTGGITIDWSTVAAVGSDTTLPGSGIIVPSGYKYLRHGQFMTRITTGTVQTVTITGTPTGGSFTLSGVKPDNQTPVTTGAIVYNAAAAAVQAALEAIFNVGAVTASGSAGGPYTLTFAEFQPLLTATSSLTGGTTPAVTPLVTTAGAGYGKYGPYDPAASDGRQTITVDGCGLIYESILKSGVLGILTLKDTDHSGLVVGGRVYKGRILQSGVATHTLALGPTFAELVAAMPRMSFVQN